MDGKPASVLGIRQPDGTPGSLAELAEGTWRAGMTKPRLDGLEAQIEDLSTKGLRFARDNNFDEAGLAALRLAIDEARRAISDQRDELEAKPLLAGGA